MITLLKTLSICNINHNCFFRFCLIWNTSELLCKAASYQSENMIYVKILLFTLICRPYLVEHPIIKKTVSSIEFSVIHTYLFAARIALLLYVLIFNTVIRIIVNFAFIWRIWWLWIRLYSSFKCFFDNIFFVR